MRPIYGILEHIVSVHETKVISKCLLIWYNGGKMLTI